MNRKTYSIIFLFFSLLILSAVCCTAQSSMAYFNQANRLFQGKKYFEASQCYEKYLAFGNAVRPHAMPFAVQKISNKKTSPQQEATYQLAECYRLINDYTKAQQWYHKSIEQTGTPYPIAKYWYAISLRANKKYDSALIAIMDFQKGYSKLDHYSFLAEKELDNLRFIQEQIAPGRKEVFRVQQQSPGDSSSGYALQLAGIDSIIYTASSSHVTPGKKGKPGPIAFNSNLYLSVGPDTLLSAAPTAFVLGADSGMNKGIASFSADGKRVFFTQWSNDPAKPAALIYSSQLTDTGWTAASAMSTEVNQPGSNNKQPFVTDDGKYLLFASDRVGGSGGYDLWYVNLDSNGQALSPRNMGGEINTPNDEASPHYHSIAGTLIFASNGRIGMGGYDIYASKGSVILNQWDIPTNPGTPLNSSKDDLYYVSTDKLNLWNSGWFSSDRNSGCCLALYTATQNNAQYITGQVVDCGNRQPLANTMLTVKDRRHVGNNKKIQTDSAGRYTFEARNLSQYQIDAVKEKYEPTSHAFTVHIETGNDSIENDVICLTLKQDGNPSLDAFQNELKKLSKSATLSRFAFEKTDIQRNAYANFDSLILLMNKYPDIVIEVEGFTDGKGSEAYNLKLAQARVDVCIAYLVKHGVVADRLIGKARGECCPIAPETINGRDNPAGRARNRRVEYKVLANDLFR